MRVSSPIGGAAMSPSQKAQIRQQIKSLEKEKKKLMKKLGIGSGTTGHNAPELATKHFKLSFAGAGTPAQTGFPAPAGGVTPAASISIPEAPSSIAPPSMELFAGISSTFQPSGGGSSVEIPEDPKDLMKRIMMMEMQIMMLKQQLGEDPNAGNADDDDDSVFE